MTTQFKNQSNVSFENRCGTVASPPQNFIPMPLTSLQSFDSSTAGIAVASSVLNKRAIDLSRAEKQSLRKNKINTVDNITYSLNIVLIFFQLCRSLSWSKNTGLPPTTKGAKLLVAL